MGFCIFWISGASDIGSKSTMTGLPSWTAHTGSQFPEADPDSFPPFLANHTSSFFHLHFMSLPVVMHWVPNRHPSSSSLCCRRRHPGVLSRMPCFARGASLPPGYPVFRFAIPNGTPVPCLTIPSFLAPAQRASLQKPHLTHPTRRDGELFWIFGILRGGYSHPPPPVPASGLLPCTTTGDQQLSLILRAPT